ncbi:helicase required for RNAi-mediated heterochromatin assembly 1 [Microdochium nivale]|nr:helicase required for RNAi-mediated heterochromatin assembly 1 [Microdochium nivale]
MATSVEGSQRSAKLRKRLKDIVAGTTQVHSPREAQLFFEALDGHEAKSQCAEQLVASRHGVEAFRISVRLDISDAFIREHSVKAVSFVADPAVELLAGGFIRTKLLLALLEPPTFWTALLNLFLNHKLDTTHYEAFARLTHGIIACPEFAGDDYTSAVQSIVDLGVLKDSQSSAVRDLGRKIEHALGLRLGTAQEQADFPNGGRHDNDFANFRNIAIYPTPDEFQTHARPFLRQANYAFTLQDSSRTEVHLDNQYRLLREDMLEEIRNEMQICLGQKKGRRSALTLGSLAVVAIELGDEKRSRKSVLAVACRQGIPQLSKLDTDKRKKYLVQNNWFLKHNSFGALFRGDQVCGFACLERDESAICEDKIHLRFEDSVSLNRALTAFKHPGEIRFVFVNAPVFAYKPVLEQLKQFHGSPLVDIILGSTEHTSESKDTTAIKEGLKALAQDLLASNDPAAILQNLGISVTALDHCQTSAISNAISQSVTLIHGPPGTGKSFTGSIIAMIIYKLTRLKVLVMSYTNHATDQFITDLCKTGIREVDIVRLGSKANEETASMSLANKKVAFHRSQESWRLIDALKNEQSAIREDVISSFGQYLSFNASFEVIMEYLEFSDDATHFFDAFTIPSNMQGWRKVGKRGKSVKADYLWARWARGEGPGVLTDSVPKHAEIVWDMDMSTRKQHIQRWLDALVRERVDTVCAMTAEYDNNQTKLDELFKQSRAEAIRSSRIIACTTTGAAMYAAQIEAAQPDFVIYEEAGEIQECHTLTSLRESVKQVVFIGDHKQLRPKVNNYALTVEKGDGYDLNRSLFERLILHEFPHTTLKAQHRMHPKISAFARALTYPDLQDGPNTEARLPIRGLQDRVIFINHDHPEAQMAEITDRRDPGQPGSKENHFEASMVLRIVRYLVQQGYGTSDMVVLTPYLGQLRLLREQLQVENDPILNDMDSSSLTQAGLLTTAASKVKKGPLRLATIDNYQGEESDIVIASLTRGNDRGDIGFMSSPERLNVLITRSRCGLILLGNMETFQKSKARDVWGKFFGLLKANGHLYDGLPAVCDRHPTRTSSLATPSDFDKSCPDGGCAEPCGGLLNCKLHKCSRRCHRVSDHSQMLCTQVMEKTCERKHKTNIMCHTQEDLCRICLKEDAEKERKRKQQEELIKRDLQLERQRLSRQETYRQQLKEMDDEILYQRRQMKYMNEEEEEKKTLAQKKKDLEDLKATHERLKIQKQKQENHKQPSNSSTGSVKVKQKQADSSSGGDSKSLADGAQAEWDYLKRFEGAQSAELDELMGMIGLETVKAEFLGIKNTVDTKLRQDVSLATQRFSCTLLGNPGTGKTTVARLYAKFLTSIGVIPGAAFEETTGAKLANGGVGGCEKLIQKILNDGGGVLFIDEAYQLTSGNSMGGAAVLDYLLPEVENLTGKVVFVLAGYSRQMESFFAHNPGLPSRFPVEMRFEDYTDNELRSILALKINKQYQDRMKCEDGLSGLYCRIVARRIGRGRGRDGFGNARTVENTLAVIVKRQGVRISQARRAGQKPDDLLFTKEDLVGPEPQEALQKSRGWTELSQMIGLKSVKQAVSALVDCIRQNYQRELAEESLIEFSLNKVFLGNPGTGKTTVAKLYGQILVDLGLLSKGEVVVKNPSDFVGAALGQSEQQTKGILAASEGKILVIDEAYALYGGGTTQGGQGDPYKTAVIDTIVAEVQSVPGEDRCVLLLGYRDQLEIMFQNVNPGLSRRFPIASGFVFDDFTDAELLTILDLKLKKQSYEATGQGRDVAMDMLRRARNRPNFGNAGEIDIILNDAKARHQSRFTKGETKSANQLEALDFDEDFNRTEHAATNIQQLFRGTVGSEDVVAKLQELQKTVQGLKELEMDPKENIPFNFIFKGPPGTGKTTTAKKMGKIFYDLGFLASAKVEECSATDLIGQYVGQTGPKVQQMLDKALGKVLFIDEAYRLAEGHFAREAIDEIVDAITKDKYHKKLVIVLAGYDADMERLMSVNEGLTSRFPEVFNFRGLSAAESISLLTQTLTTRRAQLRQRSVENDLLLDALETPSAAFEKKMSSLFSQLLNQPSWANARDVLNLGKSMFNTALPKAGSSSRRLMITESIVEEELHKLFAKRQPTRNEPQPAVEFLSTPGQHAQREADPMLKTSAPHKISLSTVKETIAHRPKVEEELPGDAEAPFPPRNIHQQTAQRDAGVSDEVWEQLQRDQQAEYEAEQEYQALLAAKEDAMGGPEYDAIVRRLVEEDDRRKKEAAMRKRLAEMGACPVGFAWIKQASGYRCAGGSHFMPDIDLEHW